MDEFVIKSLQEYEGKKFINVADEKMDLDTEEEKESLQKANESNKDMFTKMKEYLSDKVSNVQFTHRLKTIQYV